VGARGEAIAWILGLDEIARTANSRTVCPNL